MPIAGGRSEVLNLVHVVLKQGWWGPWGFAGALTSGFLQGISSWGEELFPKQAGLGGRTRDRMVFPELLKFLASWKGQGQGLETGL